MKDQIVWFNLYENRLSAVREATFERTGQTGEMGEKEMAIVSGDWPYE